MKVTSSWHIGRSRQSIDDPEVTGKFSQTIVKNLAHDGERNVAMVNHFSFDNAEFEQSVAHQGRGRILFSRRMEMAILSGCNFLDMSVLPPGTSIGLHSHDKDDEEIYIVISGRGRMTVETTSFWVGPGDVIVNPPGGTHGLENLGTEDLRLVVIDVPYPRLGHRYDFT